MARCLQGTCNQKCEELSANSTKPRCNVLRGCLHGGHLQKVKQFSSIWPKVKSNRRLGPESLSLRLFHLAESSPLGITGCPMIAYTFMEYVRGEEGGSSGANGSLFSHLRLRYGGMRKTGSLATRTKVCVNVSEPLNGDSSGPVSLEEPVQQDQNVEAQRTSGGPHLRCQTASSA